MAQHHPCSENERAQVNSTNRSSNQPLPSIQTSDDPTTKPSRSSDRPSHSRPEVPQKPELHDGQLKELEEKLERGKREVEELREKQRLVDEKIREATETLNKMPNDLDAQLDETTRRLAVAERFLLSADTVSDAEIVRMVEIINDEILQLSSVVADMIQITAQKYKLPEDVIAKFMPRALNTLGKDFLDVLRNKHLQDATAIQVGWQGILVYSCFALVRRWTIGTHTWSNVSLHHVYSRIYKNNDQAVAARWRAITFGALRKLSPPETTQWIAETTKNLLALPIVCGYIENEEEYQTISSAFRQRMGPLVNKCLELNRVIFEGVISTDVWPYVRNYGTSYNPGMESLDYEDSEEDSQELGGTRKGGNVACSLAIGLYRTRKIRSPSDTKLLIKHETIMKPKVILLTAVQSMIS